MRKIKSYRDGIHLNLEAVNMKVVGAGLFLNLLASVGIFAHLLHHVGVQEAAWFFATFLFVWSFLIVGFIVMVAGKRKIGAALITLGSLVFMIGSVLITRGSLPFIPVGLVAIVGSFLVARRGNTRPA